MPFILVRVDDRMIHGQVVVGWGSAIHPDRIILCHDEISANSWEKKLYECSFSDSQCKICVFSSEELIRYKNSSDFLKEKSLLLFETPEAALRLYDAGIKFDCLNIGGIHYQESKQELNNYIYVDAEDVQSIYQLQKRSVMIEGQDVPNAKKVNIYKLIEKKSLNFR